MKFFRFSISQVCWTLTLVVCITYYALIGKDAYNFYGDALGYYMYLPSTFIYHNHKSIERLPKDREIRPFIHSYAAQIGSGQRTPKGYVLNQYTYGVALMEAPFFFVAHAYEKMRGTAANGFSASYRKAVDLSTLIYGALGLWLTYRILRRRFSPQVSGVTTALLLLGTNLFWFVMQQQGMAHVPLFCLFALLLYLTILAHEKGKWIYFAGLGITAGLITVIRPTDVLCLLIPLFYFPASPFLKSKLAFIRSYCKSILLAGFCFLLPIIPQLLYWKWLTGYSIYDSYGPNQHFDFLHPHIIKGLFGASNGWLFYTPLMLFAFAGFIFIKKIQPFAIAILLFFIFYAWGIYSWFQPNYPNGLGSRPMVDIYPLLALPLAAFIQWISRSRLGVRIAGIFMVAVFTAINLNFTLQQAFGIIWSEDSKYAFTFQTLFRHRLNYVDLVVWDTGIPQPDERKLKLVAIRCASLSDSTLSKHVIIDSVSRKEKVFAMLPGEEYAPFALKIPYDSLLGQSIHWIRCSGVFTVAQPEYDIYQNQLLVAQIKRGDKLLSWEGVRINNKVGLKEHSDLEARLFLFRDNMRGRVSYFIPVPKDYRAGDMIQLDVWNISRKPMFLSGLCVDFFE